MRSMLIVIGGLPGTGKTSLATRLARILDAVHLRIDTIEQAIRTATMTADDPGAAGYVVAYAVAEDNLRLGRIVVADGVNALANTRAAWRAVAQRAGVTHFEVELICSDAIEHRRRVESRRPDIAGHKLPTWDEVRGWYFC
jgi:predicted kinase